MTDMNAQTAQLPVEKLRPFEGHPFKVKDNAEMEQLKEALKKLSERERKIMFLRFGLGGGEEMTQKDVADLLGISQSYISRLEKKIILRLKKEIAKME